MTRPDCGYRGNKHTQIEFKGAVFVGKCTEDRERAKATTSNILQDVHHMVTVQELLCTRLNLRVSYWGVWNQLIIEILMKHLVKIVTLGSEEEEHTPTLTSTAGCRVVFHSTDAQRYRRAGDVMIPPHRGPKRCYISDQVRFKQTFFYNVCSSYKTLYSFLLGKKVLTSILNDQFGE